MRTTVSPEQIDAIFEAHDNQHAVCVDLYRLAFPEYDNIEKIHGWPAVGEELGAYIWKRFMAFDKQHHPEVLSGGLWMNQGFSTHEGKQLGPWELSADNCKVVKKDPVREMLKRHMGPSHCLTCGD